MVFFTDKTHFYGVQWTFVPRMLSSAPRTKNGQSPLRFLFLPLDPQGIQLHGKKLPNITLEIFHLICKFVFGQGIAPNIFTCSHLLQRNVFFFFSPRGSLNMPWCPPRGSLITAIEEEREGWLCEAVGVLYKHFSDLSLLLQGMKGNIFGWFFVFFFLYFQN